MQITKKYIIRTKYNDNLRPNNYKDSRKTTFVKQKPTYRRKRSKGERTKGKQWSILEN